MWTFKPAMTGEDELRAKLRAERKARKSAERCCNKLKALNAAMSREADKREAELLQTIEERDKITAEREKRIEELEVLVKLREREMDGLTDIIKRDRQRVEAETAIEVARRELAAYQVRGEERGQHGRFIP